jgi:hypothetical protein
VQHPMEPGKKAVKARSHGIGVGEGAFKGDTESREAFPGHKVRRVTVVECGERPPWLSSWAMLMLLSLLLGVWWIVQPPPAVARAPLTWEPNDLQFMGKTTTGETYVGGPVEPRKPYQPPTRTKMRCVLRFLMSLSGLCKWLLCCRTAPHVCARMQTCCANRVSCAATARSRARLWRRRASLVVVLTPCDP